MRNEKCGMSWPETLKGKFRARTKNSELRTYNSELGEAGDSELQTMPQDMASNPIPPKRVYCQ
jgi:hypothetical protein